MLHDESEDSRENQYHVEEDSKLKADRHMFCRRLLQPVVEFKETLFLRGIYVQSTAFCG